MRIATPAVGFIKYSDFVLTGDLLTKGAALVETLEAGVAGTYLQGKGAATLPAYEKTMPPLTAQGDIIVQGAANPERVPVDSSHKVIFDSGVGNRVTWGDLFNLLPAKGDIWVKGNTWVVRMATGALDTYFKAQGAATLPIYEKLALRDTGVKIASGTRDSAGDQVITGVGFQPSVVIFVARDTDTSKVNFSIGFDNGTTRHCILVGAKCTYITFIAGFSLKIDRTGVNDIYGYISAFSGDGFTITWTLSGVCDTTFMYLALP